MIKMRMSTVTVAGLVLALAVMFLGAPMAANAGVLQGDYFTEDEIGDTSFSQNATEPVFAAVNTGTEELDFAAAHAADGMEWTATSATTTGTAEALWTFSVDINVDLGGGGNIKIPMWSSSDMFMIDYFDEGPGETEFTLGSGTRIAGVATELFDETPYHLDLVVNGTEDEVIYKGGDMDVLGGRADLWINGELAIYNINVNNTDAGLAGGEFIAHWGEASGSIDNWEIRSGAYVTPEPATMTMLALGGLAALRRRRRR